MLVTATPAGIEKFFEEAFSPAVEGKEPPSVRPELIARLIATSARHGQTVLPPQDGELLPQARFSSRSWAEVLSISVMAPSTVNRRCCADQRGK